MPIIIHKVYVLTHCLSAVHLVAEELGMISVEEDSNDWLVSVIIAGVHTSYHLLYFPVMCTG